MILPSWDEFLEQFFKVAESGVSERSDSYKGISAEALLTTPDEYLNLFDSFSTELTFVELGSGYGLGPLLFALNNPRGKAIGIEFEASRFNVGVLLKKKYQVANLQFIWADLSQCEIPEGDIYFLYFPTGPTLDRILWILGQRKNPIRLLVIESHGDLLPRLDSEPWLARVQEIPLKNQRHYGHAVIYENVAHKSFSLCDISFQDKYLSIKDGPIQWIGDSRDLQWVREGEYILRHPPRTIYANQVEKILDWQEIDEIYRPAVELRRLGNLSFKTDTRVYQGQIRKILVKPSFQVEISGGEQVEWTEIRQIYWEKVLCYDTVSGFYCYPLVR